MKSAFAIAFFASIASVLAINVIVPKVDVVAGEWQIISYCKTRSMFSDYRPQNVAFYVVKNKKDVMNDVAQALDNNDVKVLKKKSFWRSALSVGLRRCFNVALKMPVESGKYYVVVRRTDLSTFRKKYKVLTSKRINVVDIDSFKTVKEILEAKKAKKSQGDSITQGAALGGVKAEEVQKKKSWRESFRNQWGGSEEVEQPKNQGGVTGDQQVTGDVKGNSAEDTAAFYQNPTVVKPGDGQAVGSSVEYV